MVQANDAVNYLLFNNPVSSTVWSVLSSASKATGLKKTPPPAPAAATQVITTVMQPKALWELAGRNINIVRFAGLSGCSAVILGAYGAHRQFAEPDEKGRDPKQIFETANRYHFYHSIALCVVPLTRRPLVTGSLMVTGMVFFCGTCYYSSLTGKQDMNRLAPIGGISLILAWLSMML